jgi:hypothetical protein
LTIELGQRISASSTEDGTGFEVRLYSKYPFKTRTDGGLHDEFERTAWEELQRDSTKPFYRFEQYKDRPALRYATARVMAKSCVRCHNEHEDRPQKETKWEVGDVRGVLEIIRPLDKDAKRIEHGLRGTVVLVLGAGCSLLLVCGLVLLIGKRRRARAGSDLSGA